MKVLFLYIKLFFLSLHFLNLFGLNNDFDWVYYTTKNNLNIASEAAAIDHYQKIGYFQQLPYRNKFNIVILLHIQNINNINEFLQKINKFISVNNQNNYYIKININVSKKKQLNTFFLNENSENYDNNDANTFNILFKKEINDESKKLLGKMTEYIKQNIFLNEQQLEVIFSENDGRDIGGFFLLMSQLLSQSIDHDFIIKLHDYRDPNVRNILTSFMNLKVNNLLSNYDVLFSNPVVYDPKKDISKGFSLLLDNLNLPLNNFTYCLGSIFICSSKLTQFFKESKLNFLSFFKNKVIGIYNINQIQNADNLGNENIPIHINKLNSKDEMNNNDVCPSKYDLPNENNLQNTDKGDINAFYNLENLANDINYYEYFFGYLFKHLNLKSKILNYTASNYPNDNRNLYLKEKINFDYAKILIKKHNIKLMAIYFPQFHEFEENNKFWGKGFTEWTLINRYNGPIKKPHIDIGYYNMLDYHTRKKQAKIAKEHGISAFCYYHYWFKDKPVMNAGLDKILEDNEPNLPFVFCWANGSWTNTWGIAHSPKEILIEQEYGNESDWLKHYKYLSNFFKHTNYIKEDNCPIFMVINIAHIKSKNSLEMLNFFRKCAKKDGYKDLKIIYMFFELPKLNLEIDKWLDGYAEHLPNSQLQRTKCLGKDKSVLYLDMVSAYDNLNNQPKISDNYYRGIFYDFCNGARRQKGHTSIKFVNVSYSLFASMIYKQIINISNSPNKIGNYLILNSWNEWSEQAMVEPNDVDGYALLKIIKNFFVN